MKKYILSKKKWALNITIISYLCLIAIHGLPLDAYLFRVIKTKTQPIVLSLGIWQGWNMFAPNPLRFDTNIYARMHFKDGSVVTKNIEDELAKNVLLPFRLVRWTKWAKDNVRQKNHAVLWEPTLRYMVAKYGTPKNPVVKGQLYRRYVEVKMLNKEKSDIIPILKFDPPLSPEEVFFEIPKPKTKKVKSKKVAVN